MSVFYYVGIIMKFEKERNSLFVFPEGNINSSTVAQVESEIFEIVEKQTFQKLILDFSNVKYISSAGLRMVLKLKQQFDDVSIIEAPLEVYDTLSMTGFTELMDIRKALRKIDISNAEVVGDGYFSTVYRIDKDTIVKVFNRTSDPNQIERELKLAKQAFIFGIPTAISFDIVRVGNKLGVCFEMLDCASLKTIVSKHPEKAKEYLQKYVDLLKKINTTECVSNDIPKMKDIYKKKIELIKPYIGDKYYEKTMEILENIEDCNTFIHGDCHFKNIMVQNDELLLIDMDTLSVGDPIFEFAQLYAPYVAFDEDDPGNCKRFFGIEGKQAQALYYALLKGYTGKEDPILIDKIKIFAYIHMVWWNRVNEPENNVRLEGCKGRLLSILDKYDDLDILKNENLRAI